MVDITFCFQNYGLNYFFPLTKLMINDWLDTPSSNEEEYSLNDNDNADCASGVTGRQTPKFTCAICGNCYTRKVSLSNHMNLHSGAKPFECQYCAKTFSHHVYLRDHRKTHFPPTYRCNYKNKCIWARYDATNVNMLHFSCWLNKSEKSKILVPFYFSRLIDENSPHNQDRCCCERLIRCCMGGLVLLTEAQTTYSMNN